MEQFDFNTITDRHNTNSIKTDLAVLRGKPEDVLPLWVADMDFPTAPCILEEHSTKKLTTEFSGIHAQTRIILNQSKTG